MSGTPNAVVANSGIEVGDTITATICSSAWMRTRVRAAPQGAALGRLL